MNSVKKCTNYRDDFCSLAASSAWYAYPQSTGRKTEAPDVSTIYTQAGAKTPRLLWGSAGQGDQLLTFHQRTHAISLSAISENYSHTSHRGKP